MDLLRHESPIKSALNCSFSNTLLQVKQLKVEHL